MAVTVTFTCGHQQVEGGVNTPRCQQCGCMRVKSVKGPQPRVTLRGPQS